MPQKCEWGKLQGNADVASWLRGRIIEIGIHWRSLYLPAVAGIRKVHPRKELCIEGYFIEQSILFCTH